MPEKKKTIYIFLGLPASGKGTQAEIIARKIGIDEIIGVGDLIRRVIEKDLEDPFVIEIKKRYDDGVPQPDEVVNDLVSDKLKMLSKDVILDNYPFSTGQAEYLDSFIETHEINFNKPVIIYIKVDPLIAIKRATSRKVCSGCGTIYGVTDEMICEKCGSSLIVRADDNTETIEARIRHYFPRINEVVTHYRSLGGKLLEIDGEKSVSDVTEEILTRL